MASKLKNLLSVNADSKTIKGKKQGFLTGILYMMPDKRTCPHASKGCMGACLQSAGRGSFSNVKEARRAKRDLFFNNQEYFMESLVWSIEKVVRKAEREGLTPVIRLNGTSDIRYEDILLNGLNIFDHFYEVQFYDYTADPTRHMAFSGYWLNYNLTFSLKEDNLYKAVGVKTAYNTNVAVVFRNKLPETWNGFKVIDGDTNDLRFLDKPNSIVGLLAKGKAKKDTTGFVQGD